MQPVAVYLDGKRTWTKATRDLSLTLIKEENFLLLEEQQKPLEIYASN